jgi:hypothetical protein
VSNPKGNPNIAEAGKLYQWKKGEPSPNPSGRPKRLPITERYMSLLEQRLPDALRSELEAILKYKLPPRFSFGDAVAMSMLIEAVGGNLNAAREIREAVEGRSTQRIEPPPVEQPVDRRLVRARVMAGLLDMMAERAKTYNMAIPQLDNLAKAAGIDLDLPKEDERKDDKVQ